MRLGSAPPGGRPVRLTVCQQKKRLPPWWQESLYFVGRAEVRLTVLLCAGLRTLHRKLTCRNRSHSCSSRNRRSCSSNRSSAHKHSWLRSSSSCGKRTCHGSYRKDRSSSSGVGSSYCSKNSRSHSFAHNRSSFRSHSSSHNHSSDHKHSSFRNNRSHSCCRRKDRRRHSRFRPSRAPGRRQASQRQNIGSSGGLLKTRGGNNRRVVFGRRRG